VATGTGILENMKWVIPDSLRLLNGKKK
jgi:hypothetical protein